jgi:nucleolar complex protein 2
MAQSKATRKFEKNHLTGTLKRRKEFSKIKQRHQINQKKKEKRAKDNEVASPEPEARRAPVDGKLSKQDFESMNVDDFFQGGFDVPELPAKMDKSLKRKREKAEAAAVAAAGAGEDGEALTSKKASVAKKGDDDSDSDSEIDDPEAFQAQLDALAAKDPEFHKYMQENEPDALNFEEAELDEIDELSADEDEGRPKKKQKSDGNEVSKQMIAKWQKAMTRQHSLRATKEVVLAFRAAAHVSDEEDKVFKYSISDPQAYHELLLVALKHLPQVLAHHLPVKEKAGGRVTFSTDSKKFRNLSPLLKSHVTSVLHLLAHLSDSSTIRMTLTNVLPLLPYLLSFKKIIRDLTKAVTAVWSESSSTEATRIAAFLVLRRLVVIGDAGIREAVLKTAYQGLVKGSRNTTVHTIQGINLMKNSAAELWGIDATIGYTTGFTFIRQLAIHLRSSITHKTKDSYKTVYNWQYVHSLDFWSRVLAAHCQSLTEAEKGAISPLRPLIYPVVQVTLGAMRLIPTSTYFPLRFHLIRSLLRISLATGTYIPLGSALYEVLNAAEMRKPPKASTLKPLDFATAVRAPKTYLRTRVYQDGVGEQVLELVSEFFVLWAKSVAFPELALPLVVLLKRWLKDTGKHAKTPNNNAKLTSQMGLLVQKVDANIRFVEERRVKVDFAPNDRSGVENFLKEVEWQKTPLGAFVVGQRKIRDEKQTLIEEARKDDEKKREEEKAERLAKGGEEFEDEAMASGDEDEEEEDDEDVSEDEELMVDGVSDSE